MVGEVAQLRLEAAALGDVARDHRDAGDAPVGVAIGDIASDTATSLAVLAHARGLPRVDGAVGERRRDQRAVLVGLAARGTSRCAASADRLGLRVAEQALGGRVPARDRPVGVIV